MWELMENVGTDGNYRKEGITKQQAVLPHCRFWRQWPGIGDFSNFVLN
jgi:hypothetical protein